MSSSLANSDCTYHAGLPTSDSSPSSVDTAASEFSSIPYERYVFLFDPTGLVPGLSFLRGQLVDVFSYVTGPTLLLFKHLASRLEAIGFVCPKGVNFAAPLLWTTQMDELWQELVVHPYGDELFGQILAGPSGSGKSHIAVLLAMRLFANKRPVLFVDDAGTLVARAIRTTTLSNASSIGATLDAMLVARFAAMNADLIFDIVLSSTMSLVRLLHDSRAIFLADEQGHAFNLLCESSLSADVVFPLIMPNMYLGYRNARFVFAGSNQSQFEMTLNRTYRPLLRFVRPLTRDDAAKLLPTLPLYTAGRVTVEECDSFANCIPGEMVLLVRSPSAADYIRERQHAMATAIACRVDKITRPSFAFDNMLGMLDNLFEHNSMSAGTPLVSFLDLGFVYRTGNTDCCRASPLCRPATLALMQLWQSVSPHARARLHDAETDGVAFERLVWDVLVARGLSEAGVILPCRSLGALIATQFVTYRLTEYFTSSMIWSATPDVGAALARELRELSCACEARRGGLLYRCPINCRDLDFLVFHDGRWTGVQTSISSLTRHGTPDIAAIQSYFGVTLERYIYVTVNPELHVMLARRPAMGVVYQVQASQWIGL